MNPADFDGRLFASVPEAAGILGMDERTVRRSVSAGEIPGQRVGAKWLIPTWWLREIAENAQVPAPAEAAPNLDALADAVAERVLARLARLFGAMTPDNVTAGPAGPADVDPAPPLNGQKSDVDTTARI